MLSVASKALDEGLSFEKALRRGLKGIICAPEFLFLEERPTADQHINDFALASRLSYFLWSSMPDQELFSLAERDELHQPDELRGQVERLLAAPVIVHGDPRRGPGRRTALARPSRPSLLPTLAPALLPAGRFLSE